MEGFSHLFSIFESSHSLNLVDVLKRGGKQVLNSVGLDFVVQAVVREVAPVFLLVWVLFLVRIFDGRRGHVRDGTNRLQSRCARRVTPILIIILDVNVGSRRGRQKLILRTLRLLRAGLRRLVCFGFLRLLLPQGAVPEACLCCQNARQP